MSKHTREKFCATEGHAPTVRTKGYRTGWTVCTRCDITLSLGSEAA